MSDDTRLGKVAVDSVKVQDRYRVDLGSLDDLCESIRAVGLLHPIVVTRDLRLVAGQRRLEAVRLLGWSEVPATFVSGLGEASALLVSERDENTCRKPMTASELYALGKALEDLERPKAADRQRAALKQGDEFPSGSTEPNGPNHGNPTARAVGDGIGVSQAQWKRLKHIGDRASRGDQEAKEVMRDIERGAATIRSGYDRLPRPKKANPSRPEPEMGNVGDKRSIPRKKGAAKQLRQLAGKVRDLGQLVSMIDLDGLTKEEADSIAADLSEGLTALSTLKNKLRKVST